MQSLKYKHSKKKNIHETQQRTRTGMKRERRGAVGLQPLFSEVEISLEEISKKLETIYVFSPPYCKEIIPYTHTHTHISGKRATLTFTTLYLL